MASSLLERNETSHGEDSVARFVLARRVSRKGDSPVVVAMVAVRMVQPTFDEIVLVVAVRHFLVAASHELCFG